MGRLILVVLVAALGYYAYQTGILAAIGSGFVPEVGRTCELVGPTMGKQYAGSTPDNLGFVISATEMRFGNPADDGIKVTSSLDSGAVLILANHTKARILGNTSITVLRVPYQITNVELLDGDYSGSDVWVKRDNVIDTPVYQLFAQFK